MGAERTYTVRCLTTIEAEYEVSAVTGSEAMAEAEKLPGVIKALAIKEEDEPDRYR